MHIIALRLLVRFAGGMPVSIQYHPMQVQPLHQMQHSQHHGLHMQQQMGAGFGASGPALQLGALSTQGPVHVGQAGFPHPAYGQPRSVSQPDLRTGLDAHSTPQAPASQKDSSSFDFVVVRASLLCSGAKP